MVDQARSGVGSEPESDAWVSRLGPKLRARRQELGLTLARVSEQAGCTKGFLSLVERGQTTISVPSLLRLCEALGISIGSLFDYPDQTVVRRDGGAPLAMGGVGIREYLLTPVAEQHIQVMRTVLRPGGGSGGAYTLDCETIFVVVIRGALRLNIDSADIDLDVGDSYTFSARVPHSWSNPTEDESEVLWTLAPPIPGATGATAHGGE